MREILFRGKREDSGEWVYGYLNRHPSSVQISDYNNPWTIHVPPADPDDNGGVYWIDPATIGQYTGLTDKNGKKIFEGDILSTTNSNCRIWFIDYKPTAFCANQTNVNYSCVLDEFLVSCDVEVIGNIHDNPELLMEASNAPTN